MKVLRVGVVASLLLAAVVAAESYALLPLKYEATAKVFVEQRLLANDGKIHPIPLALPPERLEKASQATATVIDSPRVAEETVRRLGLPRGSANKLLDNLTAEPEPGTTIIRLTYTDTDPKRAQQIVGTVGRVAHDYFHTRDITVTLWEPAKLPSTPASPKPLRNAAKALVACLGLVAAWNIAATRRRPPPADLDRGPA
jgi:capsular polysaccharide biosynthesis protein